MIKEYKVNPHNSTVLGYPGKDLIGPKFDWEQKTTHSESLMRMLSRQGITIERRAPAVFIDDGLIGKDNQYLHVPYNWVEDATIYRVRQMILCERGIYIVVIK